MALGNSALVKVRLGSFFEGRPEVVFAYLFGSLARGSAGRLSDVDIAIFIDPLCTSQPGAFGYRSDLSAELQSLLEREVDLIILNDAATTLKYRVLRDGSLVYCRSEKERQLFHEQTVARYLDFQPFLKVQSYYLHKRLAEGVYGGGSGGG